MNTTLLKRCKYILSAILFGVISLTLCGCGSRSDDTGKEENQQSQTFAFTDIDFVLNSRSDYKIVIPQKADDYEKYAASELTLYIEQATGCTLPTVTDNGLNFSSDEKYLSVGRTVLLTQSGAQCDYTELGRDGYILKRFGNCVILCGGGGYGTLYSVYEFLHRNIEWEPYSIDEIYFKKNVSFKLAEYDVKDIPAIANRSGGWWVASKDAYFAAKWRSVTYDGKMLFNENMWFSFPHSLYKLVPPQTYYASHPDWYATSQKQPCFSSEGFKNQLIKSVVQLIETQPGLMFIPLGNEDSPERCTCTQCNEEIDKYTYTGQVIRWINSVVPEIKAQMAEKGITREVKFPMLAYYASNTELPPVKTNDSGKVVPIDESCVLNEDSPVIFAPLAANWTYPLTDKEHNAAAAANLEGWNVCSKTIMMYYYNNNHEYGFEWLDSVYPTTLNYKLAAEKNAEWLIDDCEPMYMQTCAFQVMLGYVYTKLEWDSDADTNKLINDFIDHYYHCAAEEIREYYYSMKAFFKTQRDLANEEAGRDVASIVSIKPEYMNKVFLEQMVSLLEKGIEKIKNSGYSDELKEKYISRIELEIMTPKVYLLDYFADEYSTQDYLAMVDEFEEMFYRSGVQYIVSKYPQTPTNEAKLAMWRNNKKEQ